MIPKWENEWESFGQRGGCILERREWIREREKVPAYFLHIWIYAEMVHNPRRESTNSQYTTESGAQVVIRDCEDSKTTTNAFQFRSHSVQSSSVRVELHRRAVAFSVEALECRISETHLSIGPYSNSIRGNLSVLCCDLWVSKTPPTGDFKWRAGCAELCLFDEWARVDIF